MEGNIKTSIERVIGYLEDQSKDDITIPSELNSYLRAHVPDLADDWSDILEQVGIIDSNEALEDLDTDISEINAESEDYANIIDDAKQGLYLQSILDKYASRTDMLWLDADNAVMEECAPITNQELAQRLYSIR